MPDLQFDTTLRDGEIHRIIELHVSIHANECGFDSTFADYVAGPLQAFAESSSSSSSSSRQRIWIARQHDQLVGCIAIVEVDANVAQLRWFVVSPSARRHGLGTRLLNEAIAFARECGYRSIVLWTVSKLEAAARLYRNAGFRVVEQTPVHQWGVELVEEKYELNLC